VRLVVGGKPVTTDAEGHYEAREVRSGPKAIEPANASELPAGFQIDPAAAELAGKQDEEPAHDLPLKKPKPLKDMGRYLVLDLPSGPLKMDQIQAVSVPLKTWLGGKGLNRQQTKALQALGADVLDSDALRVMMVVHPPGKLDAQGAWHRAMQGARAALRYLKGPSLVPPNRLIWTMVDPSPDDAAGTVDVLLVRVPLPRADLGKLGPRVAGRKE
jgi:hypothetical protein